MVAFARAKAKSIFSKICLPSISKVENESNQRDKVEEISIKKERSSNYFLEAIKNGGIWLS
tara:strand:- start:428 stop:610 length:183 start_codon:yes stop_codon:yes gene_type:complete